MSTRLSAFVVGVVGLFALAVGTTQGCGGSSGSGFVATCQKACDKALACGTITDATACKANCSQVHCANEAAIASASEKCLAMSDCTAALTCGQTTVPDCQPVSGTAGTNGGAGTSGGGGAGGTSGGAWTCQEDTQGCSCAQGAGAGGTSGTQTTCTATYNCCMTLSIGGYPTCTCANAATAAACTQAIAALAGTKVADCPP